jgi:hypothetical protein
MNVLFTADANNEKTGVKPSIGEVDENSVIEFLEHYPE